MNLLNPFSHLNFDMKSGNKNNNFGLSLKAFSTEQLEELLSSLLLEMRRRDSDRVKGDVLTSSKELGSVRRSGKLPEYLK